MIVNTYTPEFFETTKIDLAREIVLTAEDNIPTDVRWENETAWLMSLLDIHITRESVVLDYGCGVGRLSKPLVKKGHVVVGVDMSASMRQHAINQVDNNERFTVLPPDSITVLAAAGFQIDAVLTVWVLQHVYNLEEVIAKIDSILKPGGILFVADMNHRAVPTDNGWINDGKSTMKSLLTRFSLVQRYSYEAPQSPKTLEQHAWVAVFKK